MKSCKEFKNISYNNKYEEKLPRCIENIFKLQIITVFFINFYHPVNNNGKCIHVYAILQQNNISFLLTPWSSLQYNPKFWRLSKYAFLIKWTSNSKAYPCILQIIISGKNQQDLSRRLTTIWFTLVWKILYAIDLLFIFRFLSWIRSKKNHE